MPGDLKIVVGGNALPIIAAAGRNAPKELQWVAQRLATMIMGEAKVNIRRVLHNTPRPAGHQAWGNLSKGVTVIAKPPLAAEVGPQAVYGAIHEFGGIIRAKNAPYLCFQVPTAQDVKTRKATGWSWVRVKQVTIPARPYMGPATETVKPKVPAVVEARVRHLMGGG